MTNAPKIIISSSSVNKWATDGFNGKNGKNPILSAYNFATSIPGVSGFEIGPTFNEPDFKDTWENELTQIRDSLDGKVISFHANFLRPGKYANPARGTSVFNISMLAQWLNAAEIFKNYDGPKLASIHPAQNEGGEIEVNPIKATRFYQLASSAFYELGFKFATETMPPLAKYNNGFPAPGRLDQFKELFEMDNMHMILDLDHTRRTFPHIEQYHEFIEYALKTGKVAEIHVGGIDQYCVSDAPHAYHPAITGEEDLAFKTLQQHKDLILSQKNVPVIALEVHPLYMLIDQIKEHQVGGESGKDLDFQHLKDYITQPHIAPNAFETPKEKKDYFGEEPRAYLTDQVRLIRKALE
ncbi:hypothetical protein HN814_10805 [Candidatus Woesearchaeota archaeon]|jgi:hypothetical protein|nr:hypothetical protein [archaeon]MBT7368682.1 hypothetical protein [Candidatus Woesearchaeota archaeon]